MDIRVFTMCSLLVLMATGIAPAAASGDPQTLDERADAQAEQISDASAFVAEIDQSLRLARKGGYGPLKPGSERKLQAARDTIANLLKGHSSASELRPDERITLYNAQEEITSILRNKDKDRKVCTKEAAVGSRLQTNVCMTVGEREARARADSESAKTMMRESCIPTVDNPCSK